MYKFMFIRKGVPSLHNINIAIKTMNKKDKRNKLKRIETPVSDTDKKQHLMQLVKYVLCNVGVLCL